MYTTCIYCHRDLGRNEAIEEFPVGRRLAFDGARGRLWAVCRHCERWNLSPLETRWEAIESCERAFESTRMRVSSDNIGLARLGEGLELVRVGDPVRQEFAAWRYGDQFGRRRKRAIAITGAAAAAGGAVVIGGAVAGVSIGGMVPAISQLLQKWHRSRIVDRLWDEEGSPIRIQRMHLYTSRIVPTGGGQEWELHADFTRGWERKGGGRRRGAGDAGIGSDRAGERGRLVLTGPDAVRLAGRLMAHANRRGGSKKVVREAVSRIEAAGHPDAFLPAAAREAALAFRESGKADLAPSRMDGVSRPIPGSLSGLDTDVRLAVEMAMHEQAEREALQGELKGLEAMWRQAEEIAHIADNLFVPDSVEAFIRDERARLADRAAGREPA